MGVKVSERLLNQVVTTTSVAYSDWVNVDNYEDFSFVVRAGAADYTSTSVSDTLQMWIEASDTNDSSQHDSRRRALYLTDPSDASVQRQFDTITGNLTLPGDTDLSATLLRQQWDYKSPNVDSYVRLAYLGANNVDDLGTIVVDMIATENT